MGDCNNDPNLGVYIFIYSFFGIYLLVLVVYFSTLSICKVVECWDRRKVYTQNRDTIVVGMPVEISV